MGHSNDILSLSNSFLKTDFYGAVGGRMVHYWRDVAAGSPCLVFLPTSLYMACGSIIYRTRPN